MMVILVLFLTEVIGLLNRYRTGHSRCAATLYDWGVRGHPASVLCVRVSEQTLSQYRHRHRLQALHIANEDSIRPTMAPQAQHARRFPVGWSLYVHAWQLILGASNWSSREIVAGSDVGTTSTLRGRGEARKAEARRPKA